MFQVTAGLRFRPAVAMNISSFYRGRHHALRQNYKFHRYPPYRQDTSFEQWNSLISALSEAINSTTAACNGGVHLASGQYTPPDN